MNGVGGFEIDDMVREAFDRRSPRWQVRWDSWNRRSGSREALDLVECVIHRGEKPVSQVRPALFVPPGGVIELFGSFVLRPKRLLHRFVRFASVCRRTSSQEAPLDSPRRTLRARRSISAAHATSTSAFSSGLPSRLSRSSAATLARSSGPSFIASSRTSLTSAMRTTVALRPVAPSEARPSVAATAEVQREETPRAPPLPRGRGAE